MPGPDNNVPAAMALPEAPNVPLWSATTATAVLGAIGLLTAAWPGDGRLPLQTYWMLVAVLCGAGGLPLALRLLVHERRRERALLWNSCREQWLSDRSRQWQRPATVVAMAYATAAGHRHLARALCVHGPRLRSSYVNTLCGALMYSALRDYVPSPCLSAYRRRLRHELGAMLARMGPALVDLAGHALAVRVRHDRVLPDHEVSQLLGQLLSAHASPQRPVFAHPEDGLLWLGPWMDAPTPARWLLCIDFNLFLLPVAGQAEVVSAVLLAHPSAEASGLAQVHRPIAGEGPADCLARACAASRPTPCAVATAWLARVDLAPTAAVALARIGIAPTQQHPIDTLLGHGGAAMAQLLLIAACEQANARGQGQVLLFTDRHLQACVVRPCLEEAFA